MKFEEAVKIAKRNGYVLTRRVDEKKKKKTCTCCGKEPCECSDEDKKLEEAKRIVTENGLKFIKNSAKYAGNHPVFSTKDFQKYLIKECGTNLDDDDEDEKSFSDECEEDEDGRKKSH